MVRFVFFAYFRFQPIVFQRFITKLPNGIFFEKYPYTYLIHFFITNLQVLIFDRPVKDCPLFFDVTDHNPPLISFGCRGAKEKGFMQPCNVTVDARGHVFVVDTGNSRIKSLTPNLDFMDHITNEGLEGRSSTGLCMGSSGDSLLVINWRTKTVTEMTLEGQTIGM